MGVVIATGLVFVPPDIEITSMSSNTGLINDIINIQGFNFDYVDSIKFSNGENCNINIFNLTEGNFTVPLNGNTGYVNVFGDFIQLTGTNPQPFWTMFQIKNFSPNQSSSGNYIYLDGFHLNTLTGIDFQGPAILEDYDSLFSGENASFLLKGSDISGDGEAIFIQNINLDPEQINTFISKKQDFDLLSGYYYNIKFTNTPNNKVYENHILTLKTGNFEKIQIFQDQINSGIKTKRINLLQNIDNIDYISITSLINTGDTIYNNYISGKDASGFYINLNDNLDYDLELNILVVSGNQIENFINYNSSRFEILSGEIPNINDSYNISINNEKNYPPYILTNIEYYNLSYNDTSGYVYNISNLTDKNFDLEFIGATGVYNLKFNILKIYDNDLTNFNNFITTDSGYYYQKIYFIPNTLDTSLVSIPAEIIQISGTSTGSGTFIIPKSKYHINGPVKFKGLFDYERSDYGNFEEIPDPISVSPSGINTKGDLIISGKSFKKQNLIDGTGEYNSILVKFKNITNPKEKNNFYNTFYIIDSNTLSGYINLGSYLTGKYVIQSLTEDGGVYE